MTPLDRAQAACKERVVYRRTGSAVQETGPEVFVRGGAITVRRKA